MLLGKAVALGDPCPWVVLTLVKTMVYVHRRPGKHNANSPFNQSIVIQIKVMVIINIIIAGIINSTSHGLGTAQGCAGLFSE